MEKQKVNCDICYVQIPIYKRFSIFDKTLCSKKCIKIFRSFIKNEGKPLTKYKSRPDYGGQSAY